MRRYEHCEMCGDVVTIHRVDSNGQKYPAEYRKWHVHYYGGSSYGLIVHGVVCFDCLGISGGGSGDKESRYTRLVLATRTVLPDTKPVNRNVSASVLQRLEPDAWRILEDYCHAFGIRVYPTVLKVIR